MPLHPDSFLARYLSYATLNEAPFMFGVWGGYSALSAAVGRRVWIRHGKYPVYPNIYAMYVGEAGNGKSYAMGFVSKLLEQVLNPDMIAYDAETPEGLCQHMVQSSNGNKLSPGKGCKYICTGISGKETENHQMAIIANEFIDFMRGERERWTGMLNNIYDKSPYAYRTKGSGTDLLKGPYVTVLGALTTEVCKDLQSQSIINTGFGRRCIMQYGERQFDNPYAEPVYGEREKAIEESCLETLKSVQLLNGEMTRTEESIKWWKEWYDDHSRNIPTRSMPYNKTWMNSKSVQLMKIAMLTSLSERSDLTITPKDFETALGYLNEMEKGLFNIFGGLGRNELAAVAVEVLNYIRHKRAVVSRADLERAFFNSLAAQKGFQEMDEILRHLVSTNGLLGFTATLKTNGKSSEYFIARELALDWFVSAEAQQFGVAPSDSLLAALREERRLSEQEELRKRMEGLAGRGTAEDGNGIEDEQPQTGLVGPD